MNITRRGFMSGILAFGVAPAIVRAESLMNIVVPSQEIIVPSFNRGAATSLGGYASKTYMRKIQNSGISGQYVECAELYRGQEELMKLYNPGCLTPAEYESFSKRVLFEIRQRNGLPLYV